MLLHESSDSVRVFYWLPVTTRTKNSVSIGHEIVIYRLTDMRSLELKIL